MTWNPEPNRNTNAVPGNGNTGDVSGETTLVSAAGSGNAALAGDTNIKVASERHRHDARGRDRRG